MEPSPFAALHRKGDPLVLPNAWDVGSARALAAAGFVALGTTSLGVASARGLVDGERATRGPAVRLAHDLVAAGLGVPLTCDVEDGFDDDPAAVAELVGSLGVAGVNLEDATGGALVDPRAHAAKVRAVKDRCPGVFVNARTDGFWLGRGDVADTVERLCHYADAGADGVFVPALPVELIERVVAAVPLPLNVLASPTHDVRALAALGVARVSTGSLPYRAALYAAVRAAVAVRDGDRLPAAVPYLQVQELHRR